MKKSALFIPLSILSASVLLVGCGGGGSSVKSVVSVPVAPTTITTNSPVLLDAITNEVDYTATVVAVPPRALSVGPGVTSQTSVANLTYDSSGNLSKLVISTPSSSSGSSISWDVASSAPIRLVPGFSDQVVLEDIGKTVAVVLIDPQASAWDYQSFGAWRTGFGTGTGVIGGVSAGFKTNGAEVPVVGSATFTGKLLGAYVNAAGGASFVEGAVSVTSDFAARSLAFTTSSTNEYNLSNGATFEASSLNMAGTLTYNPGVNSFSGIVTTPGAALSGTATGAFYGPEAEELGGVFNLKGATQPESYSGSFGAKQ